MTDVTLEQRIFLRSQTAEVRQWWQN